MSEADGAEAHAVRCECCLREERWTGELHEVLAPGGLRRPAEHPELAAWKVLRGARAGLTGPVVGRCAGCEQPLVADRPGLHPVVWRLRLPDGDYHVDEDIRGPEGTLGDDAFDERIRAALAEPLQPGTALFRGALITSMLAPIALWVVALMVVIWFLANFSRPIQFP